MSNAQSVIKFLDAMGRAPDGLGIIFDMCRGAFRDADWFRQVTTLVPDPDHRAFYINVESDWWYVDDRAKEYLEKEGLASLLEANLGQRILVPTPDGDGVEVLQWLANSGTSSQAGNARPMLSC